MKKIYILCLLFIQVFSSNAQFNPGKFQARLVLPGGLPGVMRFQMRAVADVVPTSDDFCSDISFAIWWDPATAPGVLDLNVVPANSYGGFLDDDGDPVPASSSGTGPFNGLAVFFSANDIFQFPTNWVVNQWVNIADVGICTSDECNPPGFPAGVDASDFLIQGFNGDNLPNIGVQGESYTPNNAPLPLNLIAFHADKSGDRDAHLTWTTANEENTSHFSVQRSFDKTNWTEIGTVPAAGYSTIIRNYELTDLDVNDGRAARVRPYYRLVMVDRDGRSSTSPIESLIFTNSTLTEANSFELFPNPASDGVYVTWDEENTDQPTLLEFYDITGKLTYRQVVSDKSTQEYIDFGPAKMQSGVYMLRILNGTETLDHKQVVVAQKR